MDEEDDEPPSADEVATAESVACSWAVRTWAEENVHKVRASRCSGDPA